MFLLRFLFALSLQCWAAYGSYVQTRSCDGSVDNGGAMGRSFYVQLDRARGLDQGLLRLDVSHAVSQRPCNESVTDFSATLDLEFLGRHSIHQGSNASYCHRWSSSDGIHTGESLVYPLSFDLGSLPPFSTFSIRLQLASEAEQNLDCLEAEVTPALTTSTSAVLVWTPRVILLFILLVGILRGRAEKRQESHDDSNLPDLRLPGVSDCLGYMQWIFLTGSLSLHYPGFLQPIVSKLSLSSLFVTGPLTHGRVYPSVQDGIYSINGTYGGTSGLEHMHQIVGAPKTVDTWLNMVIAIVVVSFVAAFCLELVALYRKVFNSQPAPRLQRSFAASLSSRVTALLRVVLSYFTLPLSALSFYQLSLSAWLPIWHTISATLLVVSIVAAFVWLFRRLPPRNFGLLLHDYPKWYQDQHNRMPHAEKLYVTLVVALTFIRGAIIGGLQAFGPIQLSLLATSEICLLFTIRWLKVHPWFCTSTFLPALRLITTLLMVCFVRGLVHDSTRSAIGYVIISLHAVVLVFGILLPGMYHFVEIAWKAVSCETYDVSVRVSLKIIYCGCTDTIFRQSISSHPTNWQTSKPTHPGLFWFQHGDQHTQMARKTTTVLHKSTKRD